MDILPTSSDLTLLLVFLVALPSFGIDMSLPALTRAARGVTPAPADLTMSLFKLGFVIAPLIYGPASAVALNTPAKLALPGGRSLVGKYAAKGVQIYVCRVEGTATEWRFKAPEAELIEAQGRLFAKHYAGPTWEAPDGSKIVGKVVASEPAPKASTIPWLLLSTESLAPGVLAGVRFVQRVNTSGGDGPTGACPTVGAEQRVAYTADYIFYK